MKSASIYKFKQGNFLMYPERFIKDKGSHAIPPFVVEKDINYVQLAKKLVDIMEYSIGIEPPKEDERLFHKENIKQTGIKNMKMLHDGSLHVSIFTKDGKYHISPSINKGSRQGFQYTKERIEIPIGSSIDELANALKEAFEKSS